MTLQLGGPIPCWHVSPSLLLLFLLASTFDVESVVGK